jgi:Cytochrome P460
MEATVRKPILMLLASASLAVGFALWAQTDATTSFPKEFRRWAHVKSVLVGPQSVAYATEGGIHHIYANDKALEGYNSGKFPDGSVIVYDLLETKEVAGNTIEGPTRRVDVMVKQGERYAPTGGWEFMSFSGNDQINGKVTTARQETCAGCHANRKDHDSVFSEFRK